MNTNTNINIPNNTENVLPRFKTPLVLIPLGIVILVLAIVTLCILFNVRIPVTGAAKSTQDAAANISIVMTIVAIILILCFTFLPNFKDIKTLFFQISNVSYVFLYTVFLILFFRLVPKESLDKYAFIITPLTILLTAFMFYKSMKLDYILTFNINYERIKLLILFFCLITICIVYYSVDPGKYIKEYYGYSLLLTIVLAVFAFLYLIITMTMSDTTSSQNTPLGKTDSLLSRFSSFSVYGSILFVLFLSIITISVSYYKSNFLENKDKSAAVVLLVLVTSILWGIALLTNVFSDGGDKSINMDVPNLFKRGLLTMLGIMMTALLIGWVVYSIRHLSGSHGIFTFILNLFLLLFIAVLIYKTINVKMPSGNAKKTAFFDLFVNLAFYTQCIFSDTFYSIKNVISGEYSSADRNSIMMLIISIVIICAYFAVPYVYNKLNLQGGKLLINQPVYTDTVYNLGTYENLHGGVGFKYQYAVSFWVFLDASAPNTNSNSSKYTSLLNFAEKPNILYKTDTNTLMVTLEQEPDHLNTLAEYDDKGNRILYKNEKVLLQKWNNIIINYNGGTLDIFLNGELVNSSIGVVPYYKLDMLTIGEATGVRGGICNVVYYNRVLTVSNIYFIYNMVKDKTPPVPEESNTTTLQKNILAI